MKRSERAAADARQKARILERKPLNPRWWHVYHVNCDCCSYDMARMRHNNPGTWMRCDYCKKQLGDMETFYRGRFHARTESGAILMADNKERVTNENHPERTVIPGEEKNFGEKEP